jgi:lipoprotein NlpD
MNARFAALGATLLVAGCMASTGPAPVFDRSPSAPPPAATKREAPASAPAPVAAPATPPAAAPAATPKPGAAPDPVRAAEPGPVIKAAPKAEPVIAQSIDEPQARPYKEGDWRPEYHVVKKGDTLYSIALDYGQDYKDLAAWNSLEDPGVIRIDQKLRLFPPEGMAESQAAAATAEASTPVTSQVPVKSEPRGRKLPYSEQALAQLKIPAPGAATPVAATPATPTTTAAAPPRTNIPNLPPASVAAPKPAPKPAPPTADGRLTWEWPAHGKVSYTFGQGSNQKGVGIEGKMGEAILASAPGKIVYSGSGLRGYGKLVIIKHNASFLSVYAHNSQILVKEGQSVAKGQKIAEMGDTDSNRVGLHFEIRRLGKPTDPLQFLPERS